MVLCVVVLLTNARSVMRLLILLSVEIAITIAGTHTATIVLYALLTYALIARRAIVVVVATLAATVESYLGMVVLAVIAVIALTAVVAIPMTKIQMKMNMGSRLCIHRIPNSIVPVWLALNGNSTI